MSIVGDNDDKVMAANRTGAQQEEVIPEKSPNIYVEGIVVLVGMVKCGRGNMSLVSKSVISPKRNIKSAPNRYVVVWNWSNNETIIFIPRATGTSIDPKPRANTNVKRTILFLSLKIVPRYEGKRKVIQQGANKATIPPRKEAVNDTPKSAFIIN